MIDEWSDALKIQEMFAAIEFQANSYQWVQTKSTKAMGVSLGLKNLSLYPLTEDLNTHLLVFG